MDVVHHLGDCRFAAVDLRAATVIRTHCDHCDHHIGRAGGNWFGLDLAQLDEDGEIIEPLPEYQHHFCSYDCLASWAMHHAFTQPPTEATT